jgi:hypothetical protein
MESWNRDLASAVSESAFRIPPGAEVTLSLARTDDRFSVCRVVHLHGDERLDRVRGHL